MLKCGLENRSPQRSKIANERFQYKSGAAGAINGRDASASSSHSALFSAMPQFHFRVVVGAGCEHANFGFARYPESVVLEGKTVQTEINGWQWSSFCKTQYANQYGVNHFYRCHLSVIAMLDYFESLGVIKRVTDEGGYYDQRDLNALRAELEKYDALIAAMAGSLMDNFDSVEAPILNRPDFEHLEMKGLELNPHLEELVKLIKRIKKE
jgi:hypothetical protein